MFSALSLNQIEALSGENSFYKCRMVQTIHRLEPTTDRDLLKTALSLSKRARPTQKNVYHMQIFSPMKCQCFLVEKYFHPQSVERF